MTSGTALAGTIILYDNNILALPDHFESVCAEAKSNKIRLDFNQGLDHRLLTSEIIKTLKGIRHRQLKFAYDTMKDTGTVVKAIQMLTDNGIARAEWYVLVGYDTTFIEDMARVELLRESNQRPYLMIYKGDKGNPELNSILHQKRLKALARYVNKHNVFAKMTFKEFLDVPENWYMRKLFNGQNKVSETFWTVPYTLIGGKPLESNQVT